MNDLKMDAFPRFIVSDFYKRYIRTKYIETVKVTIKDFTTFRVLGRGGFGAVLPLSIIIVVRSVVIMIMVYIL